MTHEEAKKDKELQKLIKRRAKLDNDINKIVLSIQKIKDDDVKLFKICPHLWGKDGLNCCVVCGFPIQGKTSELIITENKKEALKKRINKRRDRINAKQKPITASICKLKAAEHKLWQECSHKWGKEEDGGTLAVALSRTAGAYAGGDKVKGLKMDRCIVCGGLFKEKKDD
jgi:hypothetical protein